jgi:hypothetical protein
VKIYRKPRSGRDWSQTDSKGPDKYMKWWQYTKKIILNGTIDKDGDRHTQIGIEVDEDDIIALSTALFKSQKASIEQLDKNIEFLQEAFGKLHTLVQELKSEESEYNKEEVLNDIETICWQFYLYPKDNDIPKLDSIDYPSIEPRVRNVTNKIYCNTYG